MTKLPQQEGTAFELPTNEIAAQCEQFETAWQRALEGGPVPSAEIYLRAVTESSRSTLNGELQKIANVYQQRLLEKGCGTALETDTVSPTDGSSSALDATMDFPPPSALDATMDFPPEQKGDPHQTVDPEPMTAQTGTRTTPPGAGAAFDPTIDLPKASPDPSGATMDFVPAQSQLSTDKDFSLDPEAERRGAPGQPVVFGYEVLSELGRGGMGVVYKARQLGLNRLVALKMVLAGAHASEAQLARFHTEAEAVAHLLHPNIVQIHEVGNHDGLPYFSLEYVDGGSLADKIAGQPQKVKEAAQMIEILALAMAYAHEHGIIHRDLKPANVLITQDGLPKITDFGLAKRLESDSSQTKSGTLMGTPNYMAPEQAHGKVSEMGPLADVYALGVILYEMLTGRVPFLGASVLETLEQVRSHEPVPPSRMQPRIPRDIETICLKCLEKEPQKRYETAEALARDLHHYLDGEPIEARPVGNLERVWRWCRRKPILAGLYATSAVLVLTLAIGGPVAAIAISKERNEAVRQRGIAQKAQALAEQRAESEAKAKEAEKESAKIASDQRKLAIDTMFNVVRIFETKLRDKAEMLPVRKELIEAADAGLQKISRSAETAQRADHGTGLILQRMGDIYEHMSKTEEAIKKYESSLEVFNKLSLQDPQNDLFKWNIAVCYDKLGEMRRELTGDASIAIEFYKKSLAMREALAAKPATEEVKASSRALGLLVSNFKLAELTLTLGDPVVSQSYAEKSLEVCQNRLAADPKDAIGNAYRPYAHYFLGKANSHTGAVTEARDHLERSLRLREEAVKANPLNVLAKRQIGVVYDALGDLELELRHGEQALAYLQKGHEIHSKIGDKTDNQDQFNLGNSFYKLGAAKLMLHDINGAEKDFREALKLREGLQKADPNNLQRRLELMLVQARCGQHNEASKTADQFRQRGLKSPDTAYGVASTYALCISAVGQGKSMAQLTPAERALQQGYASSALQALNEALAHGFKDVTALQVDPDLEPLQTNAAYQELIKGLKAKERPTASAT
jgi:serine/threonine-protein kinase